MREVGGGKSSFRGEDRPPWPENIAISDRYRASATKKEAARNPAERRPPALPSDQAPSPLAPIRGEGVGLGPSERARAGCWHGGRPPSLSWAEDRSDFAATRRNAPDSSPFRPRPGDAAAVASKVWFPIDLPMTDDAVREGVDALLEYRTDAQRGNPPGKAEAAYAAVLATTIMRELLSPFARQLGIEELLDEPGNRSIERTRQLMAICLRRGLPIFDYTWNGSLQTHWRLSIRGKLLLFYNGKSAAAERRRTRSPAPSSISSSGFDTSMASVAKSQRRKRKLRTP